MATIRVSGPVGRIVRDKLQRHGLAMPFFLGCKQQAEFDLSSDATKVIHKGRETFREFSLRERFGDRTFKVVFELDWDGSSISTAELLDVHFIPDPPAFAKEQPRPNPK